MDVKRFFEPLMDFSFKEFVTLRLITVLYGLGVAASAIGALRLLSAESFRGFVGGLIVAPIAFVCCVLLLRISLEVLIVIFRIAENTTRLVALAEKERNEGKPGQE